MLSLRSVISVVVGFYTSRVVLQTLGVADYGLYGLAGGIVTMFSFLNASMASATSRYLTYDLGLGVPDRLRRTFSAALQCHLLIALAVLLLAETVGLWLLTRQLIIPPDRMAAAHWVYQCSILSTLIGITQAPFSALLIAHEQMDRYAGFELLYVSLKLAAVWLLQCLPSDPLITYALLTLAVSVVVLLVYCLYCRHHFAESHPSWQWQPQTLRQLLSFSGWNLYTDGSYTLRRQCVNILLNRFFGLALNAACGIASMLQGAFWSLGYYVSAAFRPQIIKQYARGNVAAMQRLLSQSMQYTLLLFLAALVPLLLCMPFLLHLWLDEVPPYTVLLSQLMLLESLFGLVSNLFTIGIHAQGDVKPMSLANGTLELLCIPGIYLWLRFAPVPHPAYPFLFLIGMVATLAGVKGWLLKAAIPALDLKPLLLAALRPLLLALACFLLVLPLHLALPQGWLHFFAVSLSFLLLLALGTYFFLLSQGVRRRLAGKVLALMGAPFGRTY